MRLNGNPEVHDLHVMHALTEAKWESLAEEDRQHYVELAELSADIAKGNGMRRAIARHGGGQRPA